MSCVQAHGPLSARAHYSSIWQNTYCTQHKEGPLLNQRETGHSDVLVPCGMSHTKMWHVEIRLVSCLLQSRSSGQYAYTCQPEVVLQVMSSVEVYPIMHICSYTPKQVLDSSRMTALETDSFARISAIPEKSLLCLSNLQTSLCPRLFPLLSTFAGPDQFSRHIHHHRNVPAATLPFPLVNPSLKFTSPGKHRIHSSHSFLDPHHFDGCSFLPLPKAPCSIHRVID